MTFRLDLTGTRGDGLALDIPLQKFDPADPTTDLDKRRRIPLTVAEAEALRDLYTVLRMQVRDGGGEVLLDLSSERVAAQGGTERELFINPYAVIPALTSTDPGATVPSPCLSIRAHSRKTQQVISPSASRFNYDIEFDHPGSLGPRTWAEGKFKLMQDQTHEPAP